MPRVRNTRSYDSSKRRAAARRTRRSILAAASDLFVENGYPGTTMVAIAERAGVAVDTIYATIGTKSQLFRLLVEGAISGEDDAVPALEREYVRKMRAESDPYRKLALYAAAVRQIQGRLAPLVRVLQQASARDTDLAALWQEIGERRAHNMRLLATDLAETGRLREGLSIDAAGDIIWSMNASEYYLLLVHQRGWSGEQFEAFLADAWHQLLLKPRKG